MEIAGYKAGFEDLLQAQKKLREWLDALVKENRCLREEERGDYLELCARALLGQGRAITLGVDTWGRQTGQLWGGEGSELSEKVPIYNAEDFLRYLAYCDSSKMVDKPISDGWKQARQYALRAFSLALSEVIKLSPERMPFSSTEARPT
jgi:hypothetical protein